MPSVDIAGAITHHHSNVLRKPTPCSCGKGALTLLSDAAPDQWIHICCNACGTKTPGAVDIEEAIKQWNMLQLIS